MPNVAESFLKGLAHGRAELDQERDQSERELRQLILKQNLAREKLAEKIQQYQLQHGAAKEQATVTSGYPELSYPRDQIQGGLLSSRGLGLGASPAVQAPLNLTPVQSPGLPELGIQPYEIRRQTLEQQSAARIAQKMQDLYYSGQKVGPGETFGSAATGPIITGGPVKRSLQSVNRLYKDQAATLGFDPASGKYYLGDQEVNGADVKPIPAQGMFSTPEAKADIADNAQQLVDGNLLPSTLSKRGPYNQILAEANRLSKDQTGKPLNLIKLQLDYEAAKRFVGNMNSSQMIRFKGLAGSVVNTIDEVRRLGDTLKQSDIQKWNRLKRSTIQQLYGNTPQSELAAQYIGAVNTLKEEFANLANGGYAPTDPAWKLANQQINEDFGFKDLNASLTEVQRLINYRVQAFNDLTPTTLTPGAVPPPGALPSSPSQPPPRSVLPPNASVTRRP